MPDNKPSKGFTSFRVISSKAQKLLHSARRRIKDSSSEPAADVPLPKKKIQDEIIIHLSVPSIVKATFAILAILIGTYLLYLVRDKILLLLLAMFLATVINPGVRALERWGSPRGIAVLVIYFIAIGIFLFLILSLIPIVANELLSFADDISSKIPVWIEQFQNNPVLPLPLVPESIRERMGQLITGLLQTIQQEGKLEEWIGNIQSAGDFLNNVARGSLNVFQNILTFFGKLIIVLVLAFFIQIEKEKLIQWVETLLPDRFKNYAIEKGKAVQIKIGQWARGELLLMLSIFLLTLIGLFVLRIPYALTLALFAGVCEFIPVVGPLLAAIPAIIIVALNPEFGPIWILVLAVMYYVIQWCENNLLVPLIMRRAVGLSPIAILFAMLMGISFGQTIPPVLGVMLAIPVTTIIVIFLNDLRKKPDQ